MKLSIAMATYNGAPYLREQLDSLVTQERLPDELIVCDDGSSDETIDILTQFACTTPLKVEIVRNERNLGVTKNFEKALLLCSGEIIFFSDQDDVWFPKKIQRVCKILEENRGVHCVVNDMELTDGSLTPWGVTLSTLVRTLGAAETEMIAGCGMAITRQWRNFILPFPLQIAHDSWVGGLAQRLGVFHLSEERLQYYRRHGANTTNPIYSQVHARRAPLHPYFTKWLKGEAPHNFEAAQGQLAAIVERLTGGRGKGQLDFISENAVALAIQTLEREVTLVERRAEIVARPRWARMYPVISLLLSGEYELASGALSALKDVVGPRRAVRVPTQSALP
jgi:glycosyltransferase involved in cell wall biosynthesis